MFPFHTWLPDAHTEAPTAGSVILAGVLLKMGTYGFLRLAFPLFPVAAQTALPIIAGLAVIGIIYGALVAMVQKDVKRLVAYSSVSHLGFCMLGLAALNIQGIEGSMYQMLNHGISTGALFLIVGVLYERRHTRLISEFGGLAKIIPAFAAIFMITTLSSIGLPGLNGFIGEFMILMGTFRSEVLPHAQVFAVLAVSGVLLGAVYMLWMLQRVMFGQVTNERNSHLKDLSAREWGVLLPLVLLMFVMGFFPNFFVRRMDVSVENWLSRHREKITAREAPAEPAKAEPAPAEPGRERKTKIGRPKIERISPSRPEGREESRNVSTEKEKIETGGGLPPGTKQEREHLMELMRQGVIKPAPKKK